MCSNRKYLTKYSAVLIAVAVFSAFSLITADAKRGSRDPQRSGSAVYAEHCATCHGSDGSANTKRGKRKGASDLRKSRISFSKGIRIITNGKGKMPDLKGELTTKEIRSVNIYIRGFRRR